MFEFIIYRSSNKTVCPCDDAYEVNGKWYVSFDDMKSFVDFLHKEGKVLIKDKELIIVDGE